jgi:malate dehydrogenase
MLRKDLIAKNAPIFVEQGAAIEEFASRDIKVVVIANPANTNCLLLKSAAPSIPAENFTALTFLDHHRARSQIAMKLGVTVDAVQRTCIWGNHSITQVRACCRACCRVRGALRSLFFLSSISRARARKSFHLLARWPCVNGAKSGCLQSKDNLRKWEGFLRRS